MSVLYVMIFLPSITSKIFEPEQDKSNKMNCAPKEDSDEPGRQSSVRALYVAK